MPDGKGSRDSTCGRFILGGTNRESMICSNDWGWYTCMHMYMHVYMCHGMFCEWSRVTETEEAHSWCVLFLFMQRGVSICKTPRCFEELRPGFVELRYYCGNMLVPLVGWAWPNDPKEVGLPSTGNSSTTYLWFDSFSEPRTARDIGHSNSSLRNYKRLTRWWTAAHFSIVL